MSSPPSRIHELTVGSIDGTMFNFVGRHGLGQVTPSNAAYELSVDNVFQPDVSFVVYAQGDGQLIQHPQRVGIGRSKLLDGLWLQIDWLFPKGNELHLGVLGISKAQGLV